jgi:hypothetical protein
MWAIYQFPGDNRFHLYLLAMAGNGEIRNESAPYGAHGTIEAAHAAARRQEADRV